MLPLPLGEGRGEGTSIAANLIRGTIGRLYWILQQFRDVGATGSSRLQRFDYFNAFANHSDLLLAISRYAIIRVSLYQN